MTSTPTTPPDEMTQAFQADLTNLHQTAVPIVTVSASTKEDIKGFYGLGESEDKQDVVFSRAHYSMAIGVALQAWGKNMDPSKAWVFDPTSYVPTKNWKSIVFTEFIGKLLARHPRLKGLKDIVDSFGRSKLPILDAITPPLLSAVQDLKQPVLSFHIASGNIMADNGMTVVQMITDPHVRDEYLNHAENPNFYLLTFDEKTRQDAIEQATLMGKKVSPDRVLVAGSPVDPRITAIGAKKKPWKSGPLVVAVTTGGLGTNSGEIKQVLEQLLPLTRPTEQPIKVMLYAGTHQDIRELGQQLATEHDITPEILDASLVQKPFHSVTQPDLTKLADKKNDLAKFTIVHHPQITDANELLITEVLPTADVVITKPSGDMTYDAAVAGCAIFTMKEWGVWEHHVREVFEQLGIARKAIPENFKQQLEAALLVSGQQPSWITTAMQNAQEMPKRYANGANEILKRYREIAQR